MARRFKSSAFILKIESFVTFKYVHCQFFVINLMCPLSFLWEKKNSPQTLTEL